MLPPTLYLSRGLKTCEKRDPPYSHFETRRQNENCENAWLQRLNLRLRLGAPALTLCRLFCISAMFPDLRNADERALGRGTELKTLVTSAGLRGALCASLPPSLFYRPGDLGRCLSRPDARRERPDNSCTHAWTLEGSSRSGVVADQTMAGWVAHSTLRDQKMYSASLPNAKMDNVREVTNIPRTTRWMPLGHMPRVAKLDSIPDMPTSEEAGCGGQMLVGNDQIISAQMFGFRKTLPGWAS